MGYMEPSRIPGSLMKHTQNQVNVHSHVCRILLLLPYLVSKIHVSHLGQKDMTPETSTTTPASGIVRPIALCHIVLRTKPENYDRMVDWYVQFLGGWITHAAKGITFIGYDEEHHRIGIVPRADAVPRPTDNRPIVGLGHVAFGYKDLADLATCYEQKKAAGIHPVWTVNHGPTTSLYYRDPDGNEVETQVDNFDTIEETIAFMDGPEFEENPMGVDFDPEVFVKGVRSGEDERSIKKRPNIGPRTTR
ncbi:Glyoxalase/fosfomycin resistance/dioxygenase domain [Fusarium oxysporum f. sp. vasinfectum]|nr:Glyoxalase/fosfomycin resistance/dioxygenase domain [Fusarium oxysporum f. sp. vasinfectum]